MLIKQTHKRCIVKVGENALSKILNAILEAPEPTRSSVAQATGYSEVTVGKVMQAIYAMGLAEKNIKKPSDGGKVCAHMSHVDSLRFIVIDVSCRTFTMSLVTASLKILCHYSHEYSDSLRFEENLMIFLDNGYNRLCEVCTSFCATVVIAEAPDRTCRTSISGVMPVRACDISLIKERVRFVFGHLPDAVISPDVAIKQYLMNTRGTESAYIMLGQTLMMCYLSRVGNLTVCKPWNMIIDGMTLAEYMGRTTHLPKIFTAAARLVNTLDCAHSPKRIVIQSDSLALGQAFAENIADYLSATSDFHACIEISPEPYPAEIYGGAIILRKWLFSHLILSIESIKE